MGMKLKTYLTQNAINQSQFAALIGVHRSTVHRFIEGTRRPDLTTLERIHRVTGGSVTAVDFFKRKVK